MIFPLIAIGKLIAWFSRFFNIGSGGTWPGEIALFIRPNIFSYFISKVQQRIILIAGTNGKTTTAKMIKHIIINAGYQEKNIVHNDSGANLLNGLVSAFIQKASLFNTPVYDWAVLEVDEATLPAVISQIDSQKVEIIVVLLNLFRDQLDRYGEVDLIAKKWENAISKLSKNATVILNADDPQVAFLGRGLPCRVAYFGINKPERFLQTREHATDSNYCRNCGVKLKYDGVYFSHIGIWNCPECNNKRPPVYIKDWISPLPGIYNEYNTLACVAVGKEINFKNADIQRALAEFAPAFGRQEEFVLSGKKIKIFLAKNPAGFNATLHTVLDFRPKIILLALNDRIPDGRDVSWIWDVDFEMIPASTRIIVGGERAYDMGLRIKYALKSQKSLRFKLRANAKIKSQNYNSNLKIFDNLKTAIYAGLQNINYGETLYILPTYSAMLEIRKILGGRKIL
ncbi:DUF1727 domain-containing protein [Candidatus Gottesmanbacteria bacterium]|nr:DUF1727 domain-containing protein [Candidatus Gottesmanbacteria bacterium]